MSLHDWVTEPELRIRLHTWLALLWVALTVITTIWAWVVERNPLMAWVIFMSGYALSATHWAAREGAAPSAKGTS